MSNNEQRRKEAMQTLEKEIKSRDRAEKTKPLGVVALAAVSVLAIVGGIWWATTADSDDGDDGSSTTETVAEGTCVYTESGTAAREVSLPNGEDVSDEGTVSLTLTTNQGDIDLTLDRSEAPCTVNAIEHLAEEDYYNDTICHRLTTGSLAVLQCGDPSGTGAGGPGFVFANEYPTTDEEVYGDGSAITYEAGTVAMANSGQDTNGSQFFMVYEDSQLPPDYTIFGTVGETGMETLDAIAETGVEDGGTDGAPAEEVRIETATVKA